MLHRPLMIRSAIPTTVAILYGCAGAGPDLHGPEGPSLMAAYSGDWVLDPAESDNLEQEMRGAMRDPGAGMPGGGMPGGGMRGGGGRPGGGMRGGGGRPGGMGGSQMDPEVMRATMDAIHEISQVPQEFSLTLQEETVTFIQGAGSVLVLTLGADETEILQGEATLLGTAQWKKDGLEIKRETEMGGGVKDMISVDDAGRLLMKREIEFPGRSVKGTLVYRRKTPQN